LGLVNASLLKFNIATSKWAFEIEERGSKINDGSFPTLDPLGNKKFSSKMTFFPTRKHKGETSTKARKILKIGLQTIAILV
jgi:hypothetical protein